MQQGYDRPNYLQQVCDRPNYIKAERPNVCPYINSMTGTIIVLCIYGPMTGQIIVLHRYGPVKATHIMNEGMCNKTVTGRMT